MSHAQQSITILEAIQDEQFFQSWFAGPTWSSWRTFLKALFALPLDEEDAIVYQRHSGRSVAPEQAFRQAWLVVGRRGGKSLVASAAAVFLACFHDYREHL